MPISKRFAWYLTPYAAQVSFAIVCAVIISICDYGYIHILAETTDILKEIDTQDRRGEPVVVRYFYIEGLFDGIGGIVLAGKRDALRLVGLVIASTLILVVIKGISTFCNDFLMSRVGHKLIVRVRSELYERIVNAPLGILRNHRTGDLMSRVTDDVRTWLNGVGTTASTIRAIVTVPVFICLMFAKSFELTVLAVLVLPFLAYLIVRVGERVRHTSTGIQQRSADIASQLKETLAGIKIIKSFTAEESEQSRFSTANKQQYRIAMQRVRLAAMLPPLIELISAVGISAVFGFGCWQVIEGRLLFRHLTVEENLRVGGMVYAGGRHIRDDLERVYHYFPALAKLSRRVSGYLSGGEGQMLVIGRAMMAHPQILMLDEPSLGLAPMLVHEIFDIIRDINRQEGMSVLIVEQNARAALELADYAYVMEDGRIVLDGPAEQMRENEDIKEFYLGLNQAGGRKNYRDVKHYKRRKRWLG